MQLNIAQAFIKRPVLATVVSIIITLVGAIALPLLPIAKLPQIAPTQVQVTALYTGADAATAEVSTTVPLQRQIIATRGLEYVSAFTTNTGLTSISVSFPVDIDPDIAQVNVQNQVAIAEPQLPSVVNQNGVTVRQAFPSILLLFGFYSDKDANGNYLYDSTFISNYIDLYIQDELQKVSGVGNIAYFGQRQYALRFWLDPDALAARNLTAQDVVNAIRQQNIQVGAGQIGQEPMPADQMFALPMRALSRFQSVEDAENLVLKVGPQGTLIRMKDVGRVELGAQNYDQTAFYNGNPAIGLPIYQSPGSNALDVANNLKAKMEELAKSFPPGFKYVIANDSTLFVTVSLREVAITLLEAILLVILVIFIFLQNWRTTLIPALAIPISLIGAMAAALGFGFSINQLTLFGIVLATGLVVDDGIVIVEAVSTKIEQGMKPLQASLDAMKELTGAVISTSLVLMAVFIPVSFFPGSTGIVYKQFALTIAASVTFSTINALTFSPAMSAILLRPSQGARGPLGVFFGWFNRFFQWFTDQYEKVLELFVRLKILIIGIFIAGLIATVWFYQAVPTGFIPEEDQGYFFVIGSTPNSSSLQNTKDQVLLIDQIMSDFPEIEGRFCGAGVSFEGSTYNKLICFGKLKDWSKRHGEPQSVFGVLRRLNGLFRQKLTGVQAFAVNAPPVDGLSSTGGFEFFVQNRGQQPIENLVENTQRVIQAANQRPELTGVFTQFTSEVPQLLLEIDRNQVQALGVNIADIYQNLQTYFGSNFVNYYVFGPRQYQVFVQADKEFRNNPDDIGNLYVTGADGQKVQLSNLVTIKNFQYPPVLSQYNGFQAIKIQGNPTQGYSTGQAIIAMQEVADEVLQPGFGYEWTGTALQEVQSGGAAPIIFGLGLIMAFLVLAAQYESYIDPIIIMLAVPLAILGAIAAIWFRANILQADSFFPPISNNIYAQVGLVMLIGMASKNTILIVEFANQSRQLGMSIPHAAVYASRERLRPILMTAISGLVGFWPLVNAVGAGSVSRWSLGTAVFGGLLIATVLSLLFAPILYIVIKSFEQWLSNSGSKGNPPSNGKSETPSETITQLPEEDKTKVLPKKLNYFPDND